ncbi:beta-propeller domain-containing protein [Clostridium sp.]|jgi:inhibitor of cysteine peptidase|uniref:beta-propeller domain-containing protein n=1 Tax=Clostridium sp. TaxID=1506 RepID=UPI003EEE679D
MNKDSMNELKKEYDNTEVPKELDLAIENGIKKGRDYKRKRAIKPLTVLAAGIVLAFGINVVANSLIKSDTQLVAVKSSIDLPTVGSSENLQKLLKTYIDQNDGGTYGFARDGLLPMMKDSVKSESSSIDSGRAGVLANKAAESPSTEHSNTNLQVEGVDEEDLVKTDGEYIFKVNSRKIINVIKTDVDSSMEEVNNITFEDNYNVNGIFLRGNVLVVVGNSYQNLGIQNSDQNRTSIMMPSSGVTKVISYDVSNKKNIKKIRDIEIDGLYNSSRMIGSRVYIIANKNLNNIGNIKQDANIGKVYYNDSAIGTGKNLIDFNKINYLPDSVEPNYIMVAAFNVDDNKEKVNISTILGSGNSIYSSDKNLYIAGTKWKGDKNNNGTTNTILYKFAYENKGVKFVSKGEVPGTITNQFSMDEKDGNFRIATTEFNYSMVRPMTLQDSTVSNDGTTTSVDPDIQKSSNKPENQITNNLYVLDKDMKVVGKLEGLANGEQIYSVRFISDRAYIVTFMLTDPLFVIDLKNPTSPKVLGELKIPGFSNYLHPYDETHLIGFGMDTKVISEGGEDRAQTKGMKIAIFDVSNVAKPVQQFMTTIGCSGTYSEVLNNHKALLFSKEKKLLALPVFENNYNSKTNISQEGYQGAYIYNIDLVNGIKLKGKITHNDEVRNSNNNNSKFDGKYFVDRILYINDTLYTLSNGLIKANDLNTLKEKSKLKLKTFNYSKAYPIDGVRDIAPLQD